MAMIDSCRKISRGQVWFLVDNDVSMVHTQGSIQGKNRPWLVVSNNQCNQSSPIYTVVPLTTAVKPPLPTHVEFDMDGKHNTILCEQIRTVSQQAFFNAGSSYKYTMSEKYMALVDEALAVQLGLSLTFPNSDRFWESLEKLVRVRVKQAIKDSKIEAIDISKVCTLINAQVDDEIKKEEKPTETVVEVSVEESSIEKKEPMKRGKRHTWTEEEKEKFLKYYDAYGSQSTAAMYDMQPGTVYATKNKFMKEKIERDK